MDNVVSLQKKKAKKNYLISEAIGDIEGGVHKDSSQRIKDYNKKCMCTCKARFTKTGIVYGLTKIVNSH